MNWRIYYADGSTYSDQDGAPEDAPARDVQVVVISDRNHGWMTQALTDYYVWDDRGGGLRWWGVDLFGLYDYLIEPGYKCVLFGRTIAKQDFNEIFERACADKDFPKKTSYANGEYK